MPLRNKFFPIISTCRDSLLKYLVFQPMIINHAYFRLNLYLRIFPSISYVNMNWLMFIHVEEKPNTKGN